MKSLVQWASARLKRDTIGERLLRRHPLHYLRARRHLERYANAGLEERQGLLRDRLRTVLRAAASTPHGRKVASPGVLENWPLIDKAIVRNEPEAFRAEWTGISAHARTGGTTGPPLELVRSNVSVAFEQACIDGLLARLGADPTRARLAVLRGEVIHAPGRQYCSRTMGGRRLILSSYDLDRSSIDDYARALRDFRPDILWAYPSALECLCRLLAERGQTLFVPRVVCSSEVLGATTWNLARDVLGCEMADYYGLAERVAFAFALTPGEYRFLPGYSFIELVASESDRSNTLYEIVGTSLWNLAMPLVRYRTGDLVRASSALDERERARIALGLRSFSGIVGRSGDVLLLPDGARLTTINHIPRDVTRIAALQIVQESLEHVCIRIVPGPRYASEDAEAFLVRARTELPSTLRVSIEPTDALERSELGKIPVIVHRPAVRQALTAVARAIAGRAPLAMPSADDPQADARAPR
jgi:phenylacetate-CoA ligase